MTHHEVAIDRWTSSTAEPNRPTFPPSCSLTYAADVRDADAVPAHRYHMGAPDGLTFGNSEAEHLCFL